MLNDGTGNQAKEMALLVLNGTYLGAFTLILPFMFHLRSMSCHLTESHLVWTLLSLPNGPAPARTQGKNLNILFTITIHTETHNS